MDIVFSESAYGSLKMAQNYGQGEYQEACIGIIISHADGSKPSRKEIENARIEAEAKARLDWEHGTPFGGKTTDIYGFNLMLSVGDISENQPGIKRKETLERLYSVYPDVGMGQVAEETLKKTNKDLTAIHKRAAAGEKLRIWYSNQGDEICGLYWFMEQLNQWKLNNVQVSIVKLPERESDDKEKGVRKNSWGDVEPGEWHQYRSLQKAVLPVCMVNCAAQWQELQKENAPLRATLNGQLLSVPETFYDDFILRVIAEEEKEFNEAKIIGKVIDKYQLGISDSWIALRMEEMIHAGILKAVTEHDKDMPIYHRILKSTLNRKVE